MASSSEHEQIAHPFTLRREPIYYFKLTKDHFIDDELWGEPLVQINQIDLSATEYLSLDTNLSTLDLYNRDTTALNIQAGKGKTRLQHECMLRYLSKNGKYVIFYCAPFKRLLEQNKDEIERLAKSRGLAVKTYNCVAERTSTSGYGIQDNGLSADIYLMTPEFLLGSGGKRYQPQSHLKRTFKDKVLARIKEDGKEIILFLDEVHEKTHLYSPIRLAHLYRIRPNLLHKVFIASATFTREAVEVVKAVSMLTGRKITIFQANRVKSTVQANLYLHICTETYKGNKLDSVEDGLRMVLDRSIEQGHQVHILTAQKELAKAIKGSTGKLKEAMKQLDPQVFTGDSDKDKIFDETKHSIGTTFTTGINITNANSTLIVILPGTIPAQDSVNREYSYAYGVFSGGLTSLVQSLARLRNGGEIHLFMPPFVNYIESSFNKSCNEEALIIRTSLNSPVGKEAQPEQELFDAFKQIYEREKEEYTQFAKSIRGTDNRNDKLYKAHQDYFGFETLYAFTLSEYANYRMATSYSEGGQLSPVLFWSALHNQFVNCTLKSVFVERCKSEKQVLLETIKSLLGIPPEKRQPSPTKLLNVLLDIASDSNKSLPPLLEPLQTLSAARSICRNELRQNAVRKTDKLYIPEHLKPVVAPNSWQMMAEAVETMRKHPLVKYEIIALPNQKSADPSTENMVDGLLIKGFAGEAKKLSGNPFIPGTQYRKLDFADSI